MMANLMTIDEFRPLALTMEKVGPFRAPYEITFMNDQKQLPSNFFLLISANGFGKTTALDTMTALIGLLGKHQPTEYGQADLDNATGRAQLDILIEAYWEGATHKFVVSILGGNFGEHISLKIWDDDNLNKVDAEKWLRCGYQSLIKNHLKPLSTHSSEIFLGDLLATIQFSLDKKPDGFGESTFHLPTLLYFSSYRDIPKLADENNPMGGVTRTISRPNHWGYRPVQHFLPHDQSWAGSLDSLLVWLKWLDDGRFEQARELINKQVFKGTSKYLQTVRKDPPEVIIRCGDEDEEAHGLPYLSSGEKSLVQLFLRISAHMTKNTILLIDEFELHLHIRWQYKLFKALKAFVGDNSGFTVIFSSHSVEILDTYVNSLNIDEKGEETEIVKGGHLIDNLK